ncbi:MAG TPA: hypothetical protein VHI13_15325 [Candidatus Kapabacteria bacterium]|nr:hypothetical protein [Candidatus Kapabacteria bacterium]
MGSLGYRSIGWIVVQLPAPDRAGSLCCREMQIVTHSSPGREAEGVPHGDRGIARVDEHGGRCHCHSPTNDGLIPSQAYTLMATIRLQILNDLSPQSRISMFKWPVFDGAEDNSGIAPIAPSIKRRMLNTNRTICIYRPNPDIESGSSRVKV